MKIFFLSFILFSITYFKGISQNFDYNKVNTWPEKPVDYKLESMFDSSGSVGLLDERTIEYKNEGDNFFVYYRVHDVIKVKTDKGVETYNKLYIYISPNAELTSIQARIILKDKKVINIDPASGKEVEEDGRKYKLFALDGVEKNASIEYAYEIKRPFTAFGSEIFQEASLPHQEEYFTLITPEFLKFSAAGYNGFKVSQDSVINGKRIIVGYDKNVKQLEDEKYAYRDQYLKRVDYKLSYNLNNNAGVRLYTWKELAKKVYSYYVERTDKDNKAVEAFAKNIKIQTGDADAAKITSIEDYVKTNINIDKKLISQNADAIENIVKTKATNDEGVVKLFVSLFEKFFVDYQIVYASDRSGFAMDENLENWNRADDMLIYFPTTRKFISPVSIELRYPYIPFNLAASRGLYLRGTQIGSFKTAVGGFGDIPMEPFEQQSQDIDTDVAFNESLDTVLLKSKHIFKGYAAASYRPIYVFLTKDKQDEVTEEIIKSVANSTNISNIKVENTALTDCSDNKPLIISADIKTTELSENAGKKILLKIGEVIGPQVQMYQEKTRQLPVELQFPNMQQRTITLHIPEGYEAKNLNDINMSVSPKNNAIGFKSSYTQTGNTINITVNEFYKNVKYPIEDFEDFQKVVNAAADFNKIVLVLDKKS